MILRHVTRRRLDELGAIQLAARFAAEQRVAGPGSRTPIRSAVHAFVEDHAHRALVLRAVIEGRRLINDLWQMFWMTRWEPVMQARLDMQQLIERITVRQ